MTDHRDADLPEVVNDALDILCAESFRSDAAGFLSCDEAEAVACLLHWHGRSQSATDLLYRHAMMDGVRSPESPHADPLGIVSRLSELGLPPPSTDMRWIDTREVPDD